MIHYIRGSFSQTWSKAQKHVRNDPAKIQNILDYYFFHLMPY